MKTKMSVKGRSKGENNIGQSRLTFLTVLVVRGCGNCFVGVVEEAVEEATSVVTFMIVEVAASSLRLISLVSVEVAASSLCAFSSMDDERFLF